MNVRGELYIANLRNPGLARQVLEVILRNIGLTSPISAYDMDPGKVDGPDVDTRQEHILAGRCRRKCAGSRFIRRVLDHLGPHNRLTLPPIVFDHWVNLLFVLRVASFVFEFSGGSFSPPCCRFLAHGTTSGIGCILDWKALASWHFPSPPGPLHRAHARGSKASKETVPFSCPPHNVLDHG
ncbi:hypothetical protein ARMGADRAFT_1114054 [Armillaria gallica]|uniref:Uncharacterized protein n=1 Tax=Armillaria gallica TaxID=47427 RepID=A0A2H3D1U0_ARMGA|nr:hypothetical protein ARMGADRAFT_1114054 [Armillaria gallica]